MSSNVVGHGDGRSVIRMYPKLRRNFYGPSSERHSSLKILMGDITNLSKGLHVGHWAKTIAVGSDVIPESSKYFESMRSLLENPPTSSSRTQKN